MQVPGLVEKRPNLIIGDMVYLRQAYIYFAVWLSPQPAVSANMRCCMHALRVCITQGSHHLPTSLAAGAQTGQPLHQQTYCKADMLIAHLASWPA